MMERNVIDTGLRSLMIEARWFRNDLRDGVAGGWGWGERGGWMGGKAAGGVACSQELSLEGGR